MPAVAVRAVARCRFPAAALAGTPWGFLAGTLAVVVLPVLPSAAWATGATSTPAETAAAMSAPVQAARLRLKVIPTPHEEDKELNAFDSTGISLYGPRSKDKPIPAQSAVALCHRTASESFARSTRFPSGRNSRCAPGLFQVPVDHRAPPLPSPPSFP